MTVEQPAARVPNVVGRASRPLVRWHGGKWRLAPWIIAHFPEHRIYTEVYGGGGAVLLRKPRSYAEVYNDLDESIVNLFAVARDRGEELKRRLILTPFSRVELFRAYRDEPSEDPIERARRLVVRCFMGFGSNGHHRITGFRSNSNRSGTTPAHDWRNYPAALDATIERLRGVVIECNDAREVLRTHDGAQTLHYVDPPYLMSALSDTYKRYAHEMTEADHIALAEELKALNGMVILSGYQSDLYRQLYSGWHSVSCEALADGARLRREVLWLNQRATAGKQMHLDMSMASLAE